MQMSAFKYPTMFKLLLLYLLPSCLLSSKYTFHTTDKEESPVGVIIAAAITMTTTA